jgi:hypothetical protein
MRRIDVVGSLAVLLLAAAGPADAKRTVCPDGRFLQATRIVPGSADGAFDAVVIANRSVSIESGCPATRAFEKGLKDGTTRVRAKWKQCGDLKKVRLVATIVAGDEACGRLVGNLKAKKTDPIAVDAARSACGDGIVDPGAGEACDPPGDTCSAQCQTQAPPPDTTPIVAPARTWTWVPFTNAYCANGTTTGIGINPGDAGGRLLIFLNGGGACWDENTCYGLQTASYISSGYGASQFAGDAATLLQGSLFNRNDVANPFRNDSFVFVPYCTGDVHAGSRPDAVWGTHPTKHVGFQNVAAYLLRLVPTFSGASRVILSGSSAGGFGALTNWYQTQQAFGTLRVDLLDDAGPPLPAPYLTEALEQTWRNAWNLAAAIPPACTQCATDLDASIAFYGTTMTGHRAALLSYTQDNVIGLFFQLPGDQVEAGLYALAAEMMPYDIWRHFYVAGSTHTILGAPDTVSDGVSLRTFLTQMVTDDPSWASVVP